MKRKCMFLLAMALSAGLLSGCGEVDDSPVATLNPKPIIIIESSESTEEASQSVADDSSESSQDGEETQETGFLSDGEHHPIKERVVVDGMMQSWLTGEWKDAKVAQRRNMAVMINNIQVSLPQYGISKARSS